MEKTLKQIFPSALTGVLEHSTKEPPISIEGWAKWLRIQTFKDPQLESMVEKCARFALALKEGKSPRWITLLGNAGTGKSHCGMSLWLYAFSKFKWTQFEYIHKPVYWPELIRDLRGGERYKEIAEMSRWPVLFLDDIGAERDTSGFAAEQLNTILGCRVGKWTIITSNLSLEQIAGIDPRIADRIIREPGNQFIEMTTSSFALRPIAADSAPPESPVSTP